MKLLEEIEQLLAKTTRAEKAQVLQWIVRDLGDAFPGIESTPDVCGDEPCIVRTRIPACAGASQTIGSKLSRPAAELSRSAFRRPGKCLGLLPLRSRRN